jgi:hypothetical protein
MANIIQIKRRLPDSILGAGAPGALAGGELAFNEIDETLYYGASAGIIPIAGPGFLTNSYVDRTTDQTVGGVKTFTSTLSTTQNFVSDGNIDGFTYTVLGTEIVDSGKNASFAHLSASGDVTITGDLRVLGTQIVVNTETINISGTSTQIDVINNGTGTGITVNQTGEEDVVEFKDDGNTAFIIKGDSTTPGYVGIGTATPNEKLTVAGSVSASGSLTVDLDATIIDLVTVKTADYDVSTGSAVISDAANKRLRVDDKVGGWNVDYTDNGIDSQANPAGFTITTMADSGAGIIFTPAVGSHTNITQGNLVGNRTNSLSAWIIDGGYV